MLVPGLNAEGDAAASRGAHRPQEVRIDEVNAGVAVPSDVERIPLHAGAEFPHALLVHRERLVEERDGADVEVVLQVPKLREHALRGPELPGGPCDRAERARVRASLARVHDREGLACGRRDEVWIQGRKQIISRDRKAVVILDWRRIPGDANVAVVAVRQAGDAVEWRTSIEGVDEGRTDALVFVAEVDVERGRVLHHVGGDGAEGPAEADRLRVRMEALREVRHLEIVFEGRWRETEDERVVVRPSDPRLDVLGLRSKAVGVEQLHGVAALAQDRSELEQAVGLEDRIALDDLVPFLPHDGIAVEPRRIHEGDLHEAPPQTAS